MQGVQRLQTDVPHLADLLLSLGGELDVPFLQQLGVAADVDGVVADALDIAGDGKIAADDAGTLLVGLIGDETGDILGDLLIEEIQVALHLLGLGQKTAVPTEHRVKAGLDVVLGHIQPVAFLMQITADPAPAAAGRCG